MNSRALKTLMMSLALIVSACNEGTSGPIGPAGDIDNDTAAGTSNAFNGGLTGTLMNIVSGDNVPLLFDPSTGKYSRHEALYDIRGGLEQRGYELYSSANRIAFNRTAPNAGFIQTYPECIRVGSILETDTPYKGCLVVYNTDGTRRGGLVANDVLEYLAKLSPDGQFFVKSIRNQYLRPADAYISIHQSSSGESVHSLDLHTNNEYDGKAVVEWGASGEIFYTNSTDDIATVYVTAPYTLDTVRTVELTGYPGEIETLDISPDGRKLMIGYDPAALNAVSIGSVFILDLETLELTVPAIDYRDSGQRPLGDDVEGYLRHAAWSPDGKWILMMHGRNVATAVPALDPYNYDPLQISDVPVVRMYAVPADGEYIELGLDHVSTGAILLFNYTGNPEFLTDKWVGGKVFWLE